MFSYGVSRTVQPVSPVTGDTVQLNPGDTDDILLILTPAGTLANLEVDFPNDGDTILGQNVLVFTSRTITNFTMGNATTILNAPNTLLSNSISMFVKVAANTWCGNT